MNDGELLIEFVREGSQRAFAELVGRHLNLVYSAARRQTGSSHLAEEVAQAVFLELARSARKLEPAPSLATWLFVVTRRRALDAVREARRRESRENAAHEISAMNAIPSAWQKLEPLLDEAIAGLAPADRTVVLLRFFEARSLRDVGAALGISDDAAQKRVSRAVDEMRTFFNRRGIVATSAAIVTDLSAHAVQLAPALLAPAIIAAGAVQSSILANAAALTMTTLHKTVLAGSLAAAIAGFLYLGTEYKNAALRNDGLQRRLDALTERNRVLSRGPGDPGPIRGALPEEPPSPITQTPQPAPAIAATDPALRNQILAADRRSQLGELYGPLFARLNLAPVRLEQFEEMLVERQSIPFNYRMAARESGSSMSDASAAARLAQEELENRMHALLGDDAYETYRRYYESTPERSIAIRLDQKLRYSDSALVPAQVEQITQALAVTAPDRRDVLGLDTGPVVLGGNGRGSALALPVYANPKITPEMVAAVQGVLTPAQSAVFQQLQRDWQAGMDAALATAVTTETNGTESITRPLQPATQ